MIIFVSLDCDIPAYTDILFIKKCISYLNRINCGYKLVIGLVSNEEIYKYTGIFPILTDIERSITTKVIFDQVDVINTPYVCDQKFIDANKFIHTLIRSDWQKEYISEKY